MNDELDDDMLIKQNCLNTSNGSEKRKTPELVIETKTYNMANEYNDKEENNKLGSFTDDDEVL